MYIILEKWSVGAKFKRRKGKRHDGMDEKYRESYRRWQGRKYLGKHPTHLDLDATQGLLEIQEYPGYCILCPMQKIVIYRSDMIRHYALQHFNHALTMGDVKVMRCKCSDMKSHGNDRAIRNAHYHCSECHMPKKDRDQLALHLACRHGWKFEEIKHLLRNPTKWRGYVENLRQE